MAAARAGDPDATGELLQRYEPWLQVLAQMQLHCRLQRKIGVSDIVQQTMVEAVRGLANFRGSTTGQWQAWLRKILARRIAHAGRDYRRTQKRGGAGEISIDQALAQSSQRLGGLLAAQDTSPSQKAAAEEQSVILAALLQRLPDDYREVIILRNLEGLPHEEVAKRMDRSAGAVRMLWLRALAHLRDVLPVVF